MAIDSVRRSKVGGIGGALTVAVSLAAAVGADEAVARRAAIDRFVGGFAELAMFDGTVLVDVGGEIVYERSFGYASYEHEIRHDRQTRFRVASVSKSLTDAAFALLVARGELSLDSPLSRYLSDFPSADRIRISQLLDHSAGIPHTNRQPWGDGRTSLGLDEIVDRLAALPLDFEPGTDSSYSNGGYAVAAKVLEIVGGDSYDEVMRRLVFEPLDMKDSGHLADARAPIPRIATGYEPGAFPAERRHSRFYAVETRPGGGSLYSTARDLLAFTRAVFRRDFVAPELRRSILGADDDGFLSQGRSPGFVAKLLFEPERDVIVVSLSNNYAVPAGWAAAIADLATGRSDAVTWPELRPIDPRVPAVDPRVGRYRASFGDRETVIERGERGAMLIRDTENELVTGLVPLEGGRFLLPIYFQLCEQDGDTRVITCRMLSGDERYTNVLTPVAE